MLGFDPLSDSEQGIISTLPIASGPLACELFNIDRDIVILGRDTECGLVVEPKSVFCRQAAIVHRDGDEVLKEIGSMEETLAMVLEDVGEYAAGQHQLDDITLVALGRN